MATTRALRTVHLLFPYEDRLPSMPMDILMPLRPADITGLLKRMRRARKVGESADPPNALVYRRPLVLAGALELGMHVQFTGSARASGAVHPSVVASFHPARTRERVLLFLDQFELKLVGDLDNRHIETQEVFWTEVMLARLATAQRRMISPLFRELASNDPWSAADILDKGLVLRGKADVVRDLHPLLSTADLLPLLKSELWEIRDQAVTSMGRWIDTIQRAKEGSIAS